MCRTDALIWLLLARVLTDKQIQRMLGDQYSEVRTIISFTLISIFITLPGIVLVNHFDRPLLADTWIVKM